MARKTGQIIRRGSNTWLVRIYVSRDPETRRRKYIGKFMVDCGPHRRTSTACWRSGHTVATSVLLGKPSACTSIIGSTSVPVHDCGRRVFTAARSCSQGTFVRAAGKQAARGTVARGIPGALWRVAQPEVFGTNDLLHTLGSLLFSALWQAVRSEPQ